MRSKQNMQVSLNNDGEKASLKVLISDGYMMHSCTIGYFKIAGQSWHAC